MNTKNILDAPYPLKKQEPEKWKYAYISILILSFFFFFSISTFSLSEKLLIEFLGVVIALFYFIRKVRTHNLKPFPFFFWCNFIVFSSYLLAHFVGDILQIVDPISISKLPMITLKYILKSIFVGYVLGLGVYFAILNRTGAAIAFAIPIAGFFTIIISQNW